MQAVTDITCTAFGSNVFGAVCYGVAILLFDTCDYFGAFVAVLLYLFFVTGVIMLHFHFSSSLPLLRQVKEALLILVKLGWCLRHLFVG